MVNTQLAIGNYQPLRNNPRWLTAYPLRLTPIKPIIPLIINSINPKPAVPVVGMGKGVGVGPVAVAVGVMVASGVFVGDGVAVGSGVCVGVGVKSGSLNTSIQKS